MRRSPVTRGVSVCEYLGNKINVSKESVGEEKIRSPLIHRYACNHERKLYEYLLSMLMMSENQPPHAGSINTMKTTNVAVIFYQRCRDDHTISRVNAKASTIYVREVSGTQKQT